MGKLEGQEHHDLMIYQGCIPPGGGEI
jgi:hypothetical protein